MWAGRLQRIENETNLSLLEKEEHYERAIAIGLEKRGLRCETQKQFEVYYEGEQEARLIFVEDKILPAVYALRDAAESLAEQLKARMRRLNVRLGLLANFHDTRLSVTPVRLK
jgi:GxxExxY protein